MRHLPLEIVETKALTHVSSNSKHIQLCSYTSCSVSRWKRNAVARAGLTMPLCCRSEPIEQLEESFQRKDDDSEIKALTNRCKVYQCDTQESGRASKR